ncbi:MAG: hypothetical protein KA365_04305, partial [Arenimonas sp.]|nr:hypothetical protein [Arenimonas sp.]
MAKLNITVDSVFSWMQKNPWKVGSLIIGLFALWFALQGVDIYKQNQSLREAIAERDAIVKQVQAFSTKHQQQMPKTAEQFKTAASLTNKQAIISAFKKSISDAELVEIYDVSLAEAYQDIGKFGAGKLAVLESANQESQVAMRVISVAGEQKVAMAKSMGNETALLVYVQLPISVLDALMPSTITNDIYLSLRQAQVDLLKRGNAEFADTAETNAKAIAGAPWRIVASSTLPEAGLFNLGGVAELSLAVLLLILAFLIALTPAIRKRRAGLAGIEENDQSHLTLHEMQKQGV